MKSCAVIPDTKPSFSSDSRLSTKLINLDGEKSNNHG